MYPIVFENGVIHPGNVSSNVPILMLGIAKAKKSDTKAANFSFVVFSEIDMQQVISAHVTKEEITIGFINVVSRDPGFNPGTTQQTIITRMNVTSIAMWRCVFTNEGPIVSNPSVCVS